jgi:hypothetical protein
MTPEQLEAWHDAFLRKREVALLYIEEAKRFGETQVDFIWTEDEELDFPMRKALLNELKAYRIEQIHNGIRVKIGA